MDYIYIRVGTNLYRQIIVFRWVLIVFLLQLICFNFAMEEIFGRWRSRSTSYGVYISQLIRFARVSRHVADINARNKSLTAKLLQQDNRYHKLRKTSSKFYRRHYELVSKFNVGLKTLLHQGLSEPEFYGDLIYKFKKNVGRADFSDQFKKIIVRYKRIGYNINIMRQSACLVVNPITVNNFASLFNCTPGVRLNDGPDIKLFISVGWGRSIFVCCLAHRGSPVGFLLLQCSSGVVRHPRDLQVSIATRCFCRVRIFVSSYYVSVIYLFSVMIHWWVRKLSRGPNN